MRPLVKGEVVFISWYWKPSMCVAFFYGAYTINWTLTAVLGICPDTCSHVEGAP